MITTATISTGADPTHLTAAIGDGGNDVSMLQEAHVGLAIIGDHLHHDDLDDGVVEEENDIFISVGDAQNCAVNSRFFPRATFFIHLDANFSV